MAKYLENDVFKFFLPKREIRLNGFYAYFIKYFTTV